MEVRAPTHSFPTDIHRDLRKKWIHNFGKFLMILPAAQSLIVFLYTHYLFTIC